MRSMILFVALAAAGVMPTSLLAASPATKADVSAYAEKLLADRYATGKPGAAVLVARGDAVLYRGARGVADIKAGKPLSADDVFRIGSVSKQFSAAGLLTLVEAGKVSLDDPLSKYVADFPNGAHITVRELLNHTSGVKSYTGIAEVMQGSIDKDASTAQMIATFKAAKPDFAPGEAWAYNNSGYVLVGAVIEAASGKPWHEYLRTTLFQPLGLSNTHYGADPNAAARQIPGYSMDGDKIVPSRAISMTFPHAAGALLSTVDDLMKWNRALHEGRVLKNATYTQMITPIGKAVETGYGFGISVESVRGQPMLTHGGGIPGFSSMVNYVQGPDISVIVLRNSDGDDGGEPPGTLARKLVAATLGQPYPSATPIPVDAATLQSLEGVYRIDEKSARVLRVVDGKLTAQRTGGQRQALTPIGKDEFLYEDGLNRFTIQRDGKGAVSGMRFFAEGDGDGAVVARTAEALPAARQEVPLLAADLARVQGTYSANGTDMKVFMDGKQLKTQLANQPAVELFAEAPNKFFLTVVDATLEFAGDKGNAPSVTLRQNGQVIEFKRLP